MGGNAVFGGVVHLPGTDLNLEGDALLADNRCVQRLIHIGLRGGDIVFETVRQRAVHVVDDAQHIVAVVYSVDNNADRVDVINLVHDFCLV